MKVVIIGSGAQGTGLAGLLVMEKDVDQLILADYSQESLDSQGMTCFTFGCP